MTKILIADDEKLIRAGIKKILSGSLSRAVTILEARNGREAFDLCAKELPDILITDIRMPGMDGTELMEQVSGLAQKPAIIVLSGFDDFSYAQSAISSGALAYLLKPIDSAELLNVVEKALAGVRNDERQKNEERLRSIIQDGILESGANFNWQEFTKDGVCCLSLRSPLCNAKDATFLQSARHYILDRKRNFMTVLVASSDVQGLSVLPELSEQGFTMGVSRTSRNINELRRIRHESFTAFLKSYFSPEPCGTFRYEPELSVTDFTDMDSAYDKVIAGIDLMAEQDVRKNVKKLFDFDSIPENSRPESLYYLRNKIVNNLFNRYPKFTEADTYLYLKSLMIENITQVTKIVEWEAFVLDYILYLMELLKSQQGKYSAITKAVAYVSAHYKDDITMANVANEVNMNYTWFSEKFKEQVGVNFNDYLKRFRMEQAKRLLEMGTYKVYEVSAKCGFKDVKHFMKTFREMNGMSAGEWARTHG